MAKRKRIWRRKEPMRGEKILIRMLRIK